MLTTKKILVTATLTTLACLGLATLEAQAQFFHRPNPFWTPQSIVAAQAQRFVLGYQFNRALTGPFANRMPQQFGGPFGQTTFNSYSNSISPLGMAFPGVYTPHGNYNTGYANPFLNGGVYGNPYMYGGGGFANPYLYGGGGFANPYLYGGGGFANPYLYGGGYGGYGNPYSAGGYGSNLYSAGGSSNPYSSAGYGGAGGYNPYVAMGAYGAGFSPIGGALYGQAAAMQSQGQLLLNSEMARVIREQANQAKLKTKKEAFDLDLYIKDKTPTFTEVQQKVAQTTLKRIQTTATMGEILSGKALNVLLADLAVHKDKKVAANPMQLEEEVLKHLNVTLPNGGNLGLLRNEGQFSWPAALVDISPTGTRKDLNLLAEVLYRQALVNKLDPNGLRDLDAGVEKMSDSLRAKVNEVPVGQYLEAKRFLNDFQGAIRALRTPNNVPQVVAFRTFVTGGKTAQEVVDYMLARGLVFAPAISGDEGAYQAAHTALANLDISVNALVTASR